MSAIATAATVDLKLEVVVIPVSDVDRAKRFYEGLGWRLDADFPAGDNWAARRELIGRGADVSEAFHFAGFEGPRVSGHDPAGASYGTYASFRDPDGNGWLLQEINTRLPGRGLSNLDVASLTEFFREAEARHGEYQATAPKHHWSDWYAAYIVARASGRTPEEAVGDAGRHMAAILERAPK